MKNLFIVYECQLAPDFTEKPVKNIEVQFSLDSFGPHAVPLFWSEILSAKV
jgi:hypothetical protein